MNPGPTPEVEVGGPFRALSCPSLRSNHPIRIHLEPIWIVWVQGLLSILEDARRLHVQFESHSGASPWTFLEKMGNFTGAEGLLFLAPATTIAVVESRPPFDGLCHHRGPSIRGKACTWRNLTGGISNTLSTRDGYLWHTDPPSTEPGSYHRPFAESGNSAVGSWL